MMRKLFIALTLVSAGAMPVQLRGVKPLLNEKTDERGPRGHLYYAEKCSDCAYRGKQCGCQQATEYFACLTKHCYPSNNTDFAEKCTLIGDKCNGELDVQCRGADTVCRSKFNQLPMGGLGFSVNVDEDDAYCGPHGKCIGKIGLSVHIVNGPKKEVKAPKVAAPAPAAASPAPAVAAAPAPKEEKGPEIWLECGLPKKAGADIDDKKDWILCQKEVKGDDESCKVPMFKELEAGGSKKAYCVLTEGRDGKRLTQPHWTGIINVHEKKSAAAAKKEPAEEKKPAPAAKKDEKKEKPKVAADAAATKKDAKPAKEEKPKEVEAPLANDDSNKLPWMVEKEKRQAARKAAEAKKAKEAKEEPKEEKPKEEKPVKGVKNDSNLPWMAGKVNDKAPPPHAQVLS